MILKLWNAFLNKRLFKNNNNIMNLRIYCTINCTNKKYYIFKSSNTLLKRNIGILSNKFCIQSSNIPSLLNTNNEKINRSFSSEDEDVDYENIDYLEEKLTSKNLRNFLYPETENYVVSQLKECNSVQEVFEIIKNNLKDFNGDCCGQAVLVLWDLLKHCRTSESVGEVYLTKNYLLKSYLDQLKAHDMFTVLLNLLNDDLDDMSHDALSCCVLYLTRLGIDKKNEIVQNIICKIEDLISVTKPGDFSLTALSRFVLCLGGGGFSGFSVELKNKLSLIKVLPHIQYWIDNCDTVMDYKLVTICVQSLHTILQSELVENYHKLTKEMIESNKFNVNIENNLSAIIKAIVLLNYYNYNSIFYNLGFHKTVIKLIDIISGNVHKLAHFQQFYHLQKAYLYTLEPVSLENELKDCCSRWVKHFDIDENDLTDITPELLYCLVMNTVPYKQYRYNESAITLMNKTDKLHDMFVFSMNHFRPLVNLHKLLWPKILKKLQSSPHLQNSQTLHIMSSKYLEQFILTRDQNFEHQMLEWILKDLFDTTTFMEPSKLAQSSMFILGFSEYLSNEKDVFETVVQLLLSNMDQFKIFEILSISRGFRPMFSNQNSGSSQFFHYYVKLDAALTARSLELLDETSEIGLLELNMLFRSYLVRNGVPDSYLFHKLIERYKHVNVDNITSRSLRNTIYNMKSVNCLLPNLIDQFCDYITDNKDLVIGSTVSKLLHMIYTTGHTPTNDTFFTISADIISRDIDNLSGLVLLQAALSLSAYNSLNGFITKHIFSIEFLDQLDNEIKHGYSKFAYPVRIKRCLMELNRAVCLDYPEANVPWFHGKFCEQEAEANKRMPTSFSRDVYETLVAVIGDIKLIQKDVQSLYGHNIDFQLSLDKEGRVVQFKKGIDPHSKVAIMLLAESDFTIGERRLKGHLQMQQRHLEILGYKVLSIEENIWHAMYMTEPKAKINYLVSLLTDSNCYVKKI